MGLSLPKSTCCNLLSSPGIAKGVRVPYPGKRVTRTQKQEVTWKGAEKPSGLEHRARGEAGGSPGSGFGSSITDPTSDFLPFLILYLSSGWVLLTEGKSKQDCKETGRQQEGKV